MKLLGERDGFRLARVEPLSQTVNANLINRNNDLQSGEAGWIERRLPL